MIANDGRHPWLGRILLSLGVWIPLTLISIQGELYVQGEPLTRTAGIAAITNVLTETTLSVAFLWALDRWPLLGEGRRLRHVAAHLAMMAAGVLFIILMTYPSAALVGVTPGPVMQRLLHMIPPTVYTFVVMLAIHSGIRVRGEWMTAAERSAALRSQLQQTQLVVLRSQLNPHFLFNTLNAIAELVHSDPRAARRVVHQLGAYLRYSMEVSGVGEVPLRDEMAALDAFLDIVRLRFGDRAVIASAVADEALDVRVPPLLLQPLVENAVKHGFERMEGAGWLEVTGQLEGDWLRLRVANGGSGISSAPGRGAGIGIRNTRARLEQLYGPTAGLTLRPGEHGGCVAEVILPARRGAERVSLAA